VGDIGFYGNARKIDGPDGVKHEVPYYQMLLGGTYQEFGVAVQSIPARLGPVAVGRILEHFKHNREEGETFRAYVMRHKVETFRQLTADLIKPPVDVPEMFRDWGDDIEYSLKLGRGECAA
jgi:sulfite reductase (NADPH) hemoprotein beta-component/sulfite reductase (ferredoxin)